MDMQEPNERADVGRYRLKKAVVLAVGLCLLAVAAAVAYGLCSLQLKNVTQEIESSQRELQQSWVDKSLEAVHAWNAGLTENLRLVSGAEIFRLFAMDVRGLGPDGLRRLSAPDALQSGDESVVSLAEQMDYMQDLLQDFVRGKGWISARIVTQEGMPLLVRRGAAPLGEAEISLVREAVRTKTVAYGPVRMLNGMPVMSVADPMHEVLGRGGDAPVAALLAVIPVGKALTGFLSLRQEHAGLTPCILQQGVSGAEAIVLRGNAPVVETARLEHFDGSLPFKLRPALTGEGTAYSLGSRFSGLGWLVAVEAPAVMVEELVQGQARQIYGLGILGSLGAALLLAFIWATLVSRSHRATAMRFQRLYKLIRRQKMLLDSVNASLQAGLMLMDGEGRVQMCNPAFGQMAGRPEGDIVGAAIDAALPAEAAASLRAGMERVSGSDSSDSLEISVPQGGDMRLYRVSLFPFEEKKGGQAEAEVRGGCVGIFQDITEFRRRAREARRQKALLDSVNASLQAGLMLMDGEGRVQMCNPAFGQMAGRPEGDIVGAAIDAALPAEAAASLRAGMERVSGSDSSDSLEISVPQGGDMRLYRVSLFPFEEKKGGQAEAEVRGGCVGIFQDITEFRRRAREARRQKALLDSVNASLQAGLMLMDGEGRVQMCNPAFGHVAGRSEGDIVGAAIGAVLPAEAAARLRAGMERISGSDSSDSLEISVPQGGGMRLYRVSLFPFEEKKGGQAEAEVRGGCVGIFQDITEFRRRAREARRQKALLDSVNASLQAGLMLMDGEGRVQMCNPAFGHVAGRSEGDIVGAAIGAVLPAEAAARLRAGMERISGSDSSDSLEISVPQGGGMRLYRVSLFPFEEKKGGQAEAEVRGGCVGIFQDITEFRRRAREARRQKALLDSVNASLQAGLMLMDGEGRVQMCNPAFGHVAGRSEGDIVGAAIGAVLPAEAAARLRAGMERISGSDSSDSLEISVPQGGDMRLYRVSLFPLEEKKGGQADAEVRGGCVGIFQDITEFRRRAEAARQRQANSVAALVRAIESVDANLVGHSLKMEKVAELLGASMNLPTGDRETLRFAARLSQVGKIFVPRELLTKKGKLTPEEQAEVNRAPEYAYGILRDMQFSLPVPDAVYQMGERMDGSGLPRGLRGEEITLNARVLAVVNAFCAMVSARSYRAGMPPEQAIGLLREDAGFDVRVVEALARIPQAALRRAVDDAANAAEGRRGGDV